MDILDGRIGLRLRVQRQWKIHLPGEEDLTGGEVRGVSITYGYDLSPVTIL